MKIQEMIATTPIRVQPSLRGDEIRSLTSCRAGKIVPLAYVPLLREDRVSRGSLNLKFKMDETVHPLMNAINVTAYAHFVPFLAFERFHGMDSFNSSYMGEADKGTGAVIPFFETVNFNKTAGFWNKMGIQWVDGTPINSAPLEAYNVLVNYRRKARSTKLAERTKHDASLAEAFWKNPNMWHIVPDFDSAMMDGEVPLTIGNTRMNLRSSSSTIVNSNRSVPTAEAGYAPTLNSEGQYEWVNKLFVQLKDTMASVSLANIELAKKTAAWAKMREQFIGLDDDYIIDLLMQGIRVPDEAMREPILLDKASTIFGYSERHAMDGASLDMSVTTGETSLTLNFRTPPMNTGGIILITCEIVPEQLFERQLDSFLSRTDPQKLPDARRDTLDPEKVSIVKNNFVDVYHSTPNGTFGYAPLNHEWKRSLIRIGGKYYRPNPDTFVEDRQRFWAVEQPNPALTTDFYLVNNLPHSVFMDTLADPFEVMTIGGVQIVGNTVFGATLQEDNDNYEKTMDGVDTTRIIQGA
ncbi:hypothetical protein [Paracoccus sp. KR1-242]|uniref:hypothetical protein n=1 Tax=Paracoccus sp. KR1-242 TaxID=3410028 RepID=UPI003C0C9223